MKRLLLSLFIVIAVALMFVLAGCGNWGMTQFWVELVEEIPNGIRDVNYSVNLVSNRSPEDAEVRVVLETPASIPSGFTEGLPDGLTLSEDGLLSGTPTEGGAFVFTVCAQVMIHPQVYTDRTIKRRTYRLVVNTFEWARKITDDADTCESPDITADSAGNTYAVWLRYDAANGVNILVYATDPETAEIQTQELTDPTVENVVSAAVAVGDVSGTETAGVAWITDESGTPKLKFATSDDFSSRKELPLPFVDGECDLLYTSDNWYVVYTLPDRLCVWKPGDASATVIDTDATTEFYGPKVAVDGSGRLCIVYYRLVDTVHLAVQDGSGWQIYDVSEEGEHPDLCVDGDTLHIVWDETVSGTKHIFYRRFENGEFASEEIDLCEGRNPRIVKSPVTGSLWLTFQRYNDDTLVWEPFWAIVFGGAVTVEKSLADYTPPLQSISVESAVMVARSTSFTQAEAVVLMEGRGVIHWCSYTPHAWSYPETIATRNTLSYNLQVAKVGGNIYAVWRETSDWNTPGPIYFSKDEGSGWQPPAQIGSGFTAARVISMMADDTGLLHMSFYQSDGDDGEMFYSCYQNGNWTAPDNLSNSSGVKSRWPRLCVEGTSVYIVWYEGISAGNSIKLLTGPTWLPVEDVRQQAGRIVWDARIDAESDTVAIVWTERLDPSDTQTDRVFVRTKIGGSWGTPVMVSEAMDRENYPSCALMNDIGKVGIIWQRTETSTTLLFRLYDIDTYTLESVETVAVGVDAGSYPSLCYAYDSFLAVWKQVQSGKTVLIYRQRTEAGWKESYVISKKDVSHRWNKIVYTPEGALCCWIEEDSGQYELLFSEWK